MWNIKIQYPDICKYIILLGKFTFLLKAQYKKLSSHLVTLSAATAKKVLQYCVQIDMGNTSYLSGKQKKTRGQKKTKETKLSLPLLQPNQNTKPPVEKDPVMEKKRIARKKERRATLILGLIMGSFIACWFPFFFLYSISPICPICEDSPLSPCCVQGWGFSFAFWLGYSNSALNPVIYTIFNKDFRQAFKRILFR